MRTSGIVSGSRRSVKGHGRCEPNCRGRCLIVRPHHLGVFMRTRHVFILSVASALLSFAPSIAGAQRTVNRTCFDRSSIDARRYADCRYEVERSRALQREAIRDRVERQRDRARWDSIVRQAKSQARAYDLAERSRQRSAERAAQRSAERAERAMRSGVRIRRY